MNVRIEKMAESDGDEVLRIYAEGLAAGDATFETQAPGWQAWDAAHHDHSRLVARDNSDVIGWAALSPVSGRHVYGGVAEVSIYVSSAARGKGVGSLLLANLIESSEKNGIWTLQAGIFPENLASINLHLRNGFREVGRRERIGKHNGIWRDTLLFERRSPDVGK